LDLRLTAFSLSQPARPHSAKLGFRHICDHRCLPPRSPPPATRGLEKSQTDLRCFFAGGVRFAEQTIKTTAAQLNSSLLLIAVIAVLIPSAFHFSITTSANGNGLTITSEEEGRDLLAMSHAVAILLLVLYLGYLIFQMWTHAVSLVAASGSVYVYFER
jgi:hypothetical protein